MADPYKPDIVIGDSIAEGLAQAAHLPSDKAVHGSSPTRVLGFINATDKAQLQGKNVVLSSGLSNAYQSTGQFDIIREELEALQKAGAHVTLVGVSNERDGLKDDNKELREIAEKYGATFVPLTQTGADQIHPKSYQALLASVVAANGGHPQAGKETPPHEAVPPAPAPHRDSAPLPHQDAALDGIPKLDDKTAREVQTLLKQIDPQGTHYDLGHFGKKHDGVDGIVGHMTGTAIHQFEKEHSLAGNADFKDVIAALKEEAGKHPVAHAEEAHSLRTPPKGATPGAPGKSVPPRP